MVKGFIYMISSEQTPKVYIGSTRRNPICRLYEHRAKYRMYQDNRYNYVTSFELVKYDDHKLTILEESNYDSLEDLFKSEFNHMQHHDCCNTAHCPRNKLVECPCGGHYTRNSKSIHKRNQRHTKYEQQQSIQQSE